ncbi:YciI family protein [Lentzea sp. NBRC 105346]|uniref:YciI family protein n=1 Tax=Lentzea sp. NBRC 105346 TaxID=3032205 RepID=UPI00255579FB|nr:YciI family protein [Lentzea sp. NBRC 105346]
MIMMFGSQQDYDMLASWTPDDLMALHKFMGEWNNELVESGEFVDAQGLGAPVHARRVQVREGVPVVTDGPYPETAEVLAGYTIVDCASFDRATEIAAKLADTPHPEGAQLGREWYVDIRPIGGAEELDA